VVAALAAAAPEPLSASEVAEEVGLARTTAHNRLGKLVDEGVVETKKFGARSRAYWLSE
jgi:DNA-binding IclR family transcriptional regulator